MAVATGGEWFGAWPCKQGRVLLVLAEEDGEEARRRMHFASVTWSGKEKVVAQNVTLLPAAGHGVTLTTSDTDGVNGMLPETSRVEELRALLRAAVDGGRPYTLVVLDPSSRFAGGDVEKDNAAATRYLQVLETLTAPEFGAPNVLLTAHTRKRAKDDEVGSTDALRGSSAQRDGARWVAMLERRKLAEGAPRVFDLTIGKTNYGREAALVLAANDALEGALWVATAEELQQYSQAAGKKSGAALEDKVLEVL